MKLARRPASLHAFQDLSLDLLDAVSGGRTTTRTEQYTWGGQTYTKTITEVYNDQTGALERTIEDRPGSLWNDRTETDHTTGGQTTSYSTGFDVGDPQNGVGFNASFSNRYAPDGSYTGSDASANGHVRLDVPGFTLDAKGDAHGAFNLGPNGVEATFGADGRFTTSVEDQNGDRLTLDASGQFSGHVAVDPEGFTGGLHQKHDVSVQTRIDGEDDRYTVLEGTTDAQLTLRNDAVDVTIDHQGKFAHFGSYGTSLELRGNPEAGDFDIKGSGNIGFQTPIGGVQAEGQISTQVQGFEWTGELSAHGEFNLQESINGSHIRAEADLQVQPNGDFQFEAEANAYNGVNGSNVGGLLEASGNYGNLPAATYDVQGYGDAAGAEEAFYP